MGIRRPQDPAARPGVATAGRTGRCPMQTGGTRLGEQAAEAARGGPATGGILWDGRRRSGSRPISRVLSRATIHLGRTSPCASSDLPGSPCGPQERTRRFARFPIWSCSRWGLPCHRVLPPARCALTAPFHPYRHRIAAALRRFAFCCTVRGLTPPRGYLAPCPVEPGLSSAYWRSGCLADSRAHCTARASLLRCFGQRERKFIQFVPSAAGDARGQLRGL